MDFCRLLARFKNLNLNRFYSNPFNKRLKIYKYQICNAKQRNSKNICVLLTYSINQKTQNCQTVTAPALRSEFKILTFKLAKNTNNIIVKLNV